MKTLKEYASNLRLKLNVSAWLSILWTIFSMAYITYASFFEVPQENINIVNNTVGFIFGVVVGSIMNFWFGNNKEDKNKDNETNE